VTAPLPPPGWYRDPAGQPGWRWFDGNDWTNLRSNSVDQPAPAKSASPLRTLARWYVRVVFLIPLFVVVGVNIVLILTLIYVAVPVFLANLFYRLALQWGFQPHFTWGCAGAVMAAPIVAFLLGPVAMWRRVNRVSFRSVWSQEYAQGIFLTTGSVSGILGVGLLAEAMQMTERWDRLEHIFSQALPFGILLAVLLGVQAPNALQPYLRVFGVVAIIVLVAGAYAPPGKRTEPYLSVLGTAIGLLAVSVIVALTVTWTTNRPAIFRLTSSQDIWTLNLMDRLLGLPVGKVFSALVGWLRSLVGWLRSLVESVRSPSKLSGRAVFLVLAFLWIGGGVVSYLPHRHITLTSAFTMWNVGFALSVLYALAIETWRVKTTMRASFTSTDPPSGAGTGRPSG